MWLSAIKLAISTGSKLYANRQKNENKLCLMHRLMHAERMARGEEAIPGQITRGSTKQTGKTNSVLGDSLGASV